MERINYQEIKKTEIALYLEQIRELCIAATDAHDYILRFLLHWKLLPDFYIFGAFSSNRLVGVAFLMIQKRYGWLIGLRVHPEWQNKKIAHKLDEIRIQRALEQKLPVKGAVLESNSKALYIFDDLGFTFDKGLSIVYVTADKMILVPQMFGDSVLIEAETSDINRMRSFLDHNPNLNLNFHNMYGRDFVWYSMESDDDFTYLIATKRLLVLQKDDRIESIAIINVPSDNKKNRVMEIGRIWGQQAALLWRISHAYKPTTIRWYTFSTEEELQSGQYNFRIGQIMVGNELCVQRYILATKNHG